MKAVKEWKPVVRVFAGTVVIALSATAFADNTFLENTPPGGPYKFESDSNWSSKSLSDTGNWFVNGTATVDDSSGSLTVDPEGEKSNFFLAKQGKAGILNMSGGELKILANIFLQHNGGKGTLNLSGGTLFVEGNLDQGGKAIHVSGGVLNVGKVINSKVDEFKYTGGKIQCAQFGISSGVFTFQVGPGTSAIEVKNGLFGNGVLNLEVAVGFVPPADQEIVLFTFTSPADKMSWIDGSGKRWADGETIQAGGIKYTVVLTNKSFGVIPQGKPSGLVG
jgi:hypothetical protein